MCMNVVRSSASVKEGQWWWTWIHGSNSRRGLLLRISLLIINFAFGWLLRSWLISHHDASSDIIETSISVVASKVDNALAWLDNWPVGLKLNTPLSHFLSGHFRHLLHLWQDLLPAASTICAVVENGFLLGLSSGLAVVSDLLSLLALQLTACYWVTDQVFTLQKSTLHSLWNLFRGKRWNVLRKRTDSYEYEVDQLFLGTLLFTVSAFLFPTVLTYYSLFAGIHAATRALRLVLSVPVIPLHKYTT